MAIYFVNSGIHASNTGIEHAEFDRARVFRQNQIPFHILTSDWLPRLHHDLSLFGISDEESINLFDYYQDTRFVMRKSVALSDVDFGYDVRIEENKTKNLYHAYVGTQLLGRIQVEDSQVMRVEYFDGAGNLYRVDYYDDRGFISQRRYFSPNNKIEAEQWLKLDGSIAIEKMYTEIRDKKIASWKIGNITYPDLQSVRLKFYNDLNQTGYNMFLFDRANVSEWQLIDLDRDAYIAFMLHNHQVSNPQDPKAPLLNDKYEFALYNIDQFDAVISSTPQQTNDVVSRWGKQTPDTLFATVPVGVISPSVLQEPRVKVSDRKHHAMLATARISTEKRMDKMIRALAIARKQIPDLTLDLYGKVNHDRNDAALSAINDAKKDLDDPNAVTLHDYSSNVHALHQQYPVYLIFSFMEGFNLALMEAQSAGMVGLTNNVYYGPNELIVNGENGLISDFDDINAYAQKMVELFSNEEKLQEMSDKAYDLSQRYSIENIWQAWQPVLEDYQKKGGHIE